MSPWCLSDIGDVSLPITATNSAYELMAVRGSSDTAVSVKSTVTAYAALTLFLSGTCNVVAYFLDAISLAEFYASSNVLVTLALADSDPDYYSGTFTVSDSLIGPDSVDISPVFLYFSLTVNETFSDYS